MYTFSIITSFGIFQAFFYFLLLLKERNRSGSNFFLGFLVLSLGLTLNYEVIYPTGWYATLPILIKSYIPTQYLIGPFLYLYIRALMGYAPRLRGPELIHFIPFLLILAYLTPFYLSPATEKIVYGDAYVQPGRGPFTEECIIWGGMQISIWYYGVKCLILIRPVFRQLRKQKDYNEMFRNWQLLLFLSIFLILLIFLATDFLMLFKDCTLHQFNHLISLSLTGVIMVLGLVGMNRMDRVTKRITLSRKGEGVSDGELIRRIILILEKEKFFLDPTLTLETLAHQLKTSRTELSRIINKERGMNFYDFINTFRVEEFKRRLFLEEYRNCNILEVALDSGFNAKSTFNKVFKNITGLTPLQYKKSESTG